MKCDELNCKRTAQFTFLREPVQWSQFACADHLAEIAAHLLARHTSRVTLMAYDPIAHAELVPPAFRPNPPTTN